MSDEFSTCYRHSAIKLKSEPRMSDSARDRTTGPTRRDFVYALLVAAASTSVSPIQADLSQVVASEKTAKGRNTMNINKLLLCSPKDGIVSEILVEDGATAKTGDIICSINPDDEKHMLGRLAAFEQLLTIETKQLNPETVAMRRNLHEKNLEIADAYVVYAQVKHGTAEANYRHDASGFVDPVAQASAALAKALAEKDKAGNQIKLFDFAISQAKDRMKVLQAELDKERTFVEQRLQRLQIRCPGSGEIRLLVGRQSFVKLGHPLAELTVSF